MNCADPAFKYAVSRMDAKQNTFEVCQCKIADALATHQQLHDGERFEE